MVDRKNDNLKNDVENLKKWRQDTTIAWKIWMAFWGGVSMTVTSIGAVIADRWEDIKHFFQGLKP